MKILQVLNEGNVKYVTCRVGNLILTERVITLEEVNIWSFH
jgi:hypothetical protein